MLNLWLLFKVAKMFCSIFKIAFENETAHFYRPSFYLTFPMLFFLKVHIFHHQAKAFRPQISYACCNSLNALNRNTILIRELETDSEVFCYRCI